MNSLSFFAAIRIPGARRHKGWTLTAILLVASATTARAQLTWSSNLIVNGDAESNFGSSTTATDAPVGWATTGSLTAFRYGGGAYADLKIGRDPLPPIPGSVFFAGGNGGVINGGTAISTGTQTFDFSSISGAINANEAHYDLSGWIGGWDNQSDQAQLSVSFYDAGHHLTGTATIGPVTAADRSNVTGLYFRQSTGFIPASTRSAELLLTMSRNMNVGTYNDAYADNLSLRVAVPEPGSIASVAAMAMLGFGIWRRRVQPQALVPSVLTHTGPTLDP